VVWTSQPPFCAWGRGIATVSGEYSQITITRVTLGEAEPALAHSEQRIYVTGLLDAEYTTRYIYLPIVFVDLPPHENAGAASGTFQRCGPPD
jgi:hypothetical protein